MIPLLACPGDLSATLIWAALGVLAFPFVLVLGVVMAIAHRPDPSSRKVDPPQPWTLRKSFILSLVLGVADLLIGTLGDWGLGAAAVAFLIASVVIAVVQWGSRPRPFEGAAWMLLEMALVGMAFANFYVLAFRHME